VIKTTSSRLGRSSVKGSVCNAGASGYRYPLIGAQPRREGSEVGLLVASSPAIHTDNSPSIGEGKLSGARKPFDAISARPSNGLQPPQQSEERTSGGGAALGLVYSQTSPTPIAVNPVKTRLAKMRSGVITGARLHQEAAKMGGFRGKWALVTTTYAKTGDWRPWHIADTLDCIRVWMRRRNVQCRYVWVAELQQRGAMHYHVLVWLPKGLTLPKPDKQGWWRHGWTKIEWARNAVGYMAKYASKGDEAARFPKGARIHGCGGLQGQQLQEARYWRRPQWLRDATEVSQVVRRAVGGWIDLETGESWRSPWEVRFRGGQVFIQLRDSS